MNEFENTVADIENELNEIRAGRSNGAKYLFSPQMLEIIRGSESKDVDNILRLYAALAESLIFASGGQIATLHLSIILSPNFAADEMFYATLTDQGLRADAPADIALDGAKLFFRRGQTSFAAQEYEKASRFYKRAVEIAPHFRGAWLALAGTYELLGETSKATEAFDTAAKLREVK